MRTTLALAALLSASGSLVAACSLGALDGYATGGAGGHGGGAPGTGGMMGASSSSGTTTSSSSGGPGGAPPCDMCLKACVDKNTDPNNCGACGVTCGSGYKCMSGVCGNVVEDVSTFYATCAVLHDGELWCWGRDVWGEIGVASSDPGNDKCLTGDKCRGTPAKVAGLPAGDPAVQVSAGREATCVRTASGAVYCFGSNAAGLLGHATTLDTTCTKGSAGTTTGPCSPTPQKVLLPEPAAHVAVGTVNTCVLTTSSNVYCWGSNVAGAVSSPPAATNVYTPVKNANVNGDADQLWVSNDVEAVRDAVCVRRTATKQIDCWGASSSGDLFPATTSPSCPSADTKCSAAAIPVPMNFSMPAGTKVTADAMAIGTAAGMALQGSSVLAWGSNSYSQLTGSSNPSTPVSPQQITGLPPIKAVSTQFFTSLFLDASGDVWSLGWSDEGQLGNGVFDAGMCPNGLGQHCAIQVVKIPSLHNVVKIRGGGFNGAAITSDGKLWMWAGNYQGSLGHTPVATDGMCPGTNFACDPSPVQVPLP